MNMFRGQRAQTDEICMYGWQCRFKGKCLKKHPGEKGFDYSLQIARMRTKQACPLKGSCQQKGWCIYLHPGDKLNVQCTDRRCKQNDDCFYLHQNSFALSKEQIENLRLTMEERKTKSEEVKNRGNELFKSKDYQAALEQYTIAISLEPHDSKFYSNRAQCLRRMGKFEEALIDCEQALEYDKTNLRALHLRVILNCERAKSIKDVEIVAVLKNSLESCELIETLARQKNEQRFMDQSQLLQKMKQLIEYKQQEVENSELYVFINRMRHIVSRSKLPQEQIRNLNGKLAELGQIKPDQEEVPEYLRCVISFDEFISPVITSEGITYEKKYLETHINKNGNFDPSTRKQIKKYYQNHAISQAVQYYQEKKERLSLPTLHELVQSIDFSTL